MSTKDDICKFYQAGRQCPHGDRCKFAHSGPVQTTSIPSNQNTKAEESQQSKTPPTTTTVAASSDARPVAWGPGSSPPSIVAPKPNGTFAGKLQGVKPPQAPTRTSSAPPSQQQSEKKPISVPFKTGLQYGSSPSNKDSKYKNNSQPLVEEQAQQVANQTGKPSITTTATPTVGATPSSGGPSPTSNRSWASMAAGVKTETNNSDQQQSLSTNSEPVLEKNRGEVSSSQQNTNGADQTTVSSPPTIQTMQENAQNNPHEDGGPTPPSGGGPAFIRNNSSGSDGGKGKNTRICSYWERGTCRRGENCHFAHPPIPAGGFVSGDGGKGGGGKGKGSGKGGKGSPRSGKGSGKGGGGSMDMNDHRGAPPNNNHHHQKQGGVGGANATGLNYVMPGIPKGTNFPYAQQQQMAYAQMMQAVPHWSAPPGGIDGTMQQRQAMAAQMMYAQQQYYVNQQMGNMNLAGRVRSGSGGSNMLTPAVVPMVPPHVLSSDVGASSSDSSKQQQQIPRNIDRGAPQPLMVPSYDNSLVFSVDVECVATGVQHHDRSIAQIGLVDCYGRMLLNVLVKPNKPILSYLTPLTGLTKEKIDAYGQTEEVALAMLREALPSNAILVGMNIRKDIEWLHLEEKKDFDACIDLADLFRVWNTQMSSFTYFSLEHIAHCWLNVPHTGPGGHDAVMDAFHSMSLFNSYRTVQTDRQTLHDLQMKTLNTPVQPSFAKVNPVFEGCCMGNRKTCKCGAPFYG